MVRGDNVAVPAEETPALSSVTTVIQPSKGWARLGLEGALAVPRVLYFLAWKSILIQFKQAVLGVAWAVLNPVLTMIVFTVIFNKILHVGTGNYPVAYPVRVRWPLAVEPVSGSLATAGTSLVGNSNLITKVYFPRLVIPGSAVLGNLPNFLISFIVLCILMAATGWCPPGRWSSCHSSRRSRYSPPWVSLWPSALYVLYRDVRYDSSRFWCRSGCICRRSL